MVTVTIRTSKPIDTNTLTPHMKRGFLQSIEFFRSQHTQERLTGRPGLHRRTGALAASFRSGVTGETLDNIRGFVSTSSPYAAIHEFGGVITANGSHSRCGSGKYLAIPLQHTKAGVARESSPCNIPGLFVIRSKAGNLLLVQRMRDGSIKPMYVLKRSVRIPARLGLMDTWGSASNVERIGRLVSQAIDNWERESG